MPTDLDDIDAFLKRTGRTPFSEAKDKPPPADEEAPDPSRSNLFTGALQGAVLGPLEAAAQGGRWIASVRGNDPEVMTADSPLNRALAAGERFRKDVESTTPGMVGEFGGMMGTGYGAEFGVGRLLGVAPTTLRGLAGRAALGTATGALSQPASSPNELATQAALGGGLSFLKGKSGMMAGREAAKTASLQAASRTASADEQMARAAMAGVKRKDPMYQQLAADYGEARETARQARAAIPGRVPDGFWPFMHNLPHYMKIRIAQWLMKTVPPTGAAGAGGVVMKNLENPQ